jgi:hypothetical protein
MRNRRTFCPSCAEFEYLETRNLMSSVSITPGPTLSPPKGTLIPVSIDTPRLYLPEGHEIPFTINTSGQGVAGDEGSITVTITVTKQTGPMNKILLQVTDIIPVSGTQMNTISGSIDTTGMGPAFVSVDIAAYNTGGHSYELGVTSHGFWIPPL